MKWEGWYGSKMGNKPVLKIYKLVVIIVLIMLIGCSPKSSDEIIESETWSRIKDIEWSSDNGFAGDGFYFYEEDGKAMCMFMIYGSGLPIIFHTDSEILSIDDDMIEVKLIIDPESDKEVTFLLEVEADRILNGDLVYESVFGRDPREAIVGQ